MPETEQTAQDLAFQRECEASYARLAADPVALADYEAESDLLGNAATEVVEPL